MSRFQSLIATWLILTLATAGVVGISPILHHWVEHGGQGAPHVHRGTVGWHSHHTRAVFQTPPSGNAHSHSHPHSTLPKAGAATVPFTHNHAPFELPHIDLDLLREWLARLFQKASDAPLGEPGNNPDHHHDSVFQLVAGGLIDRACTSATLAVPLLLEARPPTTCDGRLVLPAWEGQYASRAPPGAGS
ncbi:MAG TPA: hypothetical protein VNO52_18435 [Methylomirabilota bacterium]|nr:hypothetical protein [Methylomirabilota bacterium]